MKNIYSSKDFQKDFNESKSFTNLTLNNLKKADSFISQIKASNESHQADDEDETFKDEDVSLAILNKKLHNI